MKTSLISLLCYVSIITVSDAATVWFDKAGICNGFYSHVPSVGCGDKNDRMTSINVTDAISKARGRDSSFNGYSVGETKLIDENGNFVASSGELVAAINKLGGTGITSVGASYSCTDGKQLSSSGACYEPEDGAATYIDFESGSEDDGWQVSGGNIGRGSSTGGGKGCQYYRDFDVVIHWAPRDYEDIVTTPYSYSTGLGSSINISPRPIDWTGIPKNAPTSNYHYHWDGGTAPGRWTQNGTLVRQIPLPSSHNGWTLRGLYLMNYSMAENAKEPKSSATGAEKQEWINYLWTVRARADNLVSEATNTYSTARLGFLEGQTNLEYINVEDDGAWGNSYTRWSIWSCTPITTVHMYAGWTKNCANDMCNLTVKHNGLHNNNNRGDVFYDTGNNRCPDGTMPKDTDTYNPSCKGASSTISYSYSKYRDATTGEAISCKNVPEGGTCQINSSTVTLAATPTNLSCGTGTNYRFYKWTTQDATMHDAGSTVNCTADVLGTSPANITGLLCDCNNTSNGAKCAVLCSDFGNGGGRDGDAKEEVVVTLDLKGGDYSGGTTFNLEDGAKLPTGVTRGDGAVLDYWYPANASESASNKVTEIDKSDGKSQTFVASYKCPETEGSEGRYYMNGNGTCVQENGHYVNGATGEMIPPSQVSCYNNNGTPVYCYFKGTVHLHDKPNGSNLTVTNGNEGTQYQTLWCNRAFCRKGNANGEFVSNINLPRTTDYTFRGYFLRPDQQVQAPGQPAIELITDHSTTAGEAFARFYPGNTSNGVTTMNIYDVFDMVYVTTTPLETSEYNIDLYGAWARNCATDPELNPAGCLMRLGQTNNTNSYGLGKGDVRYDTECVGGKHLANNSDGTYNPQCEDDTGDITFTYNFHNQYGETIECGSITPSACMTGNNISLVSTSNFNTACGGKYALRYLNINNEWYRPSYQVGCNTNVFGQGGKVTIEGYACETCKDDALEHGHCEDMTSSGQINYNPINPDNYGVGSSGYSVGYGGLWGADPSGPNAYSACRRIVCDAGYQVWTNNNGVRSCITEHEACVLSGKPATECDAISFSCPSSGYAPTANSNVTISGPNKSGTSCSYTIGCSSGVPEWTTGGAAGSTTVICQGSQCTSSWVQSQLNGKSCFVCPHYNGADWSVSPGVPTQSGLQCSYHILCNGRVSCPRILKKDGVAVSGNSDYVTCNEGVNHQCTAGYGSYQSLYFLTTEFAKYECVNTSSGINDCGETSQP